MPKTDEDEVTVEELQEKLEALTTELNAVKETVMKPAELAKPGAPEQKKPPVDLKTGLWSDNPGEALDSWHEQKMKPLVEQFEQSLAVLTDKQQKDVKKDLEMFARYTEECDEMLERVDPRFRAHPEVLKEINNTVRGRHYDELLKESYDKLPAAEEKLTYVEIPTVEGKEDSPKQRVELSPEELQMAKRQKLSPEEYAKWKNEELTIPLQNQKK